MKVCTSQTAVMIILFLYIIFYKLSAPKEQNIFPANNKIFSYIQGSRSVSNI